MSIKILTGIFIASFIIQLAYYLLIYLRILFRNNLSVKNNDLLPVSVIISARNEAENLKKYLPLVLNQDYPDFEIVVINDNSSDNTKEILSEFKSEYKNLTILDAEKNLNGKGNKKRALTQAISKAKYDLLIFTDADCYPVSDIWLKKMVSAYSENTEILIGYGAYEKQNGFLNRIIRFETLFNALQFLSFADLGFPFMAVGRNISYKKSVFFKINGYESHKNILSGDDDLFINEAADATNTKIITDFESKTVSVPKQKFKEYLKQKRRHFSSSSEYRLRNKIIIGTEIISRFIFYLFLFILIIYGAEYETAFIFFFIRMIVSVSVIKLFAVKIKEPNILFFIPIFDILIPVLNLIIFSGAVFDKKIIWK